MKQSEMPIGSVITLGHPDNKCLAVKCENGWRLLYDGSLVDLEEFRDYWDDYLPDKKVKAADSAFLTKHFRLDRSSSDYGTHLWLFNRIRLGSFNTMTPRWPHVYRSYDEYCNNVFAIHLFPLVAIDIWWRRKQRTLEDGLCDECLREDENYRNSSRTG